MSETKFYELFCASPYCDNDIVRIYNDEQVSFVASKVRRIDVISKEKMFCSCKVCSTRNEIYVEDDKYKSKIAKKIL